MRLTPRGLRRWFLAGGGLVFRACWTALVLAGPGNVMASRVCVSGVWRGNSSDGWRGANLGFFPVSRNLALSWRGAGGGGPSSAAQRTTEQTHPARHEKILIKKTFEARWYLLCARVDLRNLPILKPQWPSRPWREGEICPASRTLRAIGRTDPRSRPRTEISGRAAPASRTVLHRGAFGARSVRAPRHLAPRHLPEARQAVDGTLSAYLFYHLLC